jgi:adenylylsulfate kinase
MIIWMTGQPGAGKTTLAGWLKAHFHDKGIVIDGDDIREVYQNKDYSEAGRRVNITTAQTLAKFLHHKGFTVIVSLVSPYRDQREEFKNEMGVNLTEVYIHTSEDRGRNHFHVANYEPPLENFVDVDTSNENEFTTFNKLREKLMI